MGGRTVGAEHDALGGRASTQSATTGRGRTHPIPIAHRGINRAGELFDPLVNGVTVGAPIDVSFLSGEGVRLNTLGSRIVYTLPQTLTAGEFSLLATGLSTHSAGDSTKLFAMQEGFTDLTTNPYRATIEKRDHGTVTFRFIAGNSDTRADGERIRRVQSFARGTFGSSPGAMAVARLIVLEGGEQGRAIYDRSSTYCGTYRRRPTSRCWRAPDARVSIPRRCLARLFGTSAVEPSTTRRIGRPSAESINYCARCASTYPKTSRIAGEAAAHRVAFDELQLNFRGWDGARRAR